MKLEYTVKSVSNGKVLKFKARLTGKGYPKKYGIEFDQTYARLAEHSLMRLILAITLELDVYSRLIDNPQHF